MTMCTVQTYKRAGRLSLQLIETTARADTGSESRPQHVGTVKHALFTLTRYVRKVLF